MNGNWSQLDMTSEVGASTTVAALTLTTFWAMVTIGRVLVAALQRWVPTHRAYHVLPLVLAAAFVVIASLPDGATATGIVAFGLAGLGCSALLPLTISFAQENLVAISSAAAGLVIAFYQLGYGIAAFGTGPIIDAGVSLSTMFAVAAAAAVVMAAMSFAIARPEPAAKEAEPAPTWAPSQT
jgi:predicted MFS family arabinose efflux permease